MEDYWKGYWDVPEWTCAPSCHRVSESECICVELGAVVGEIFVDVSQKFVVVNVHVVQMAALLCVVVCAVKCTHAGCWCCWTENGEGMLMCVRELMWWFLAVYRGTCNLLKTIRCEECTTSNLA